MQENLGRHLFAKGSGYMALFICLQTLPSPSQAPYLPKAEAGRAGAVATTGPGSWAWTSGASPGAASGRCTSSRAASAGKAGGKPSSSTLVTVLPMVNQSLIWSTVSFRNILPGAQELPQPPGSKGGKSLDLSSRPSATTTVPEAPPLPPC